ncbi:MAG: helix-turn-helix transcriptional regulator [Saprospiraceae bacterium]|nr:helix-turn-helix transcriptional regulator [Candidatus Defluviibacterium haderslevense]
MQDYNNLIQQLKDRKEALGLTQEQIADRMQTERVRVNELFSSKKTNMTVKTLLKLCNALNITIHLASNSGK